MPVIAALSGAITILSGTRKQPRLSSRLENGLSPSVETGSEWKSNRKLIGVRGKTSAIAVPRLVVDLFCVRSIEIKTVYGSSHDIPGLRNRPLSFSAYILTCSNKGWLAR